MKPYSQEKIWLVWCRTRQKVEKVNLNFTGDWLPSSCIGTRRFFCTDCTHWLAPGDCSGFFFFGFSDPYSPSIVMFFLKDLSLNLTLHPSYFGPQMDQYLRDKLLSDVEGTCTGQFGYIVCVLDCMNIDVGRGRIIPTTGMAEFEVKYRAVVWKPFKGEVVDGIVTTVNKMGFFADVGPLSVFVSTHLISSDMKFNPSANPPAYVSPDETIEKGSRVRLKIVGTRTDVNEIYAIGSIKEDYLGPSPM